ncbi:MAG: ABC transporter permease subunit [Chitinivibrionales bacterium]|nr:ABC transporter permease subunit [Chitinivibrionales bacterium]
MAAGAKRITLANLKSYWYIYLLVVPSAVVLGLFAYYPAASALYHAFFRWNGDYVNEFVGLANFVEAFRDPVLHWGFLVIFILIAANLIKMIPSIVAAVVIHRLASPKASYLYKVLFVVPMIIPWMVGLLIWKFFYDPSVGILNKLLDATGGMWLLQRIDALFNWGVFVEGVNPVWLGDAKLVIPALILWGFPWVGVVGVLLYLAGLQSIDESVYEAAEIDGVGWFKKFLYIELPLILTQVRLNLILMIIATLKGYGLIYVLFGTSGGPKGVAMVPGLYMFKNAFETGRAGYACGIGFILFMFILILTEINNRYVRVKK